MLLRKDYDFYPTGTSFSQSEHTNGFKMQNYGKKRPIYKNTPEKLKMTKYPSSQKYNFRVEFQNSDFLNPHNWTYKA